MIKLVIWVLALITMHYLSLNHKVIIPIPDASIVLPAQETAAILSPQPPHQQIHSS